MGQPPPLGVTAFIVGACACGSPHAEEAPAVEDGTESTSEATTTSAATEPEPQPEATETEGGLDLRPASPRTLFVNFDGGEFTKSDRDSAAHNRAACLRSPVAVLEAYDGNAEAKTAILEHVERLFVGTAVQVVSSRPTEGDDYDMVMVGGTAESVLSDGRKAGFACHIDCGDAYAGNIAWVFTRELPDGGTPSQIGRMIAHEAAHTWGFAHVEGEDHVMYARAEAVPGDWAPGCQPFDTDADHAFCFEVHEQLCPEGTGQDARALLRALFGESDS